MKEQFHLKGHGTYTVSTWANWKIPSSYYTTNLPLCHAVFLTGASRLKVWALIGSVVFHYETIERAPPVIMSA